MMKKQLRTVLLVTILTLVLGIAAVQAQSGGYDLNWWTIDGGGGTVNAGDYLLNSTVGQPDANAVLTGGGYTLTGGFWSGSAMPHRSLYLPLVTRSR